MNGAPHPLNPLSATRRLVWGLVHSKRKKDVGEGLQLAGALMESDEIDDDRKKDLVYIKCVAMYKLGGFLTVNVTLYLGLANWSCLMGLWMPVVSFL